MLNNLISIEDSKLFNISEVQIQIQWTHEIDLNNEYMSLSWELTIDKHKKETDEEAASKSFSCKFIF